MRGRFVLGSLLALSACGTGSPVAADKRPSPYDTMRALTAAGNTDINQWTDPTTGCRYIIVVFDGYKSGGTAITPALQSGGAPDCGKADK